MTPELPDELYLRWLYRQVASVRTKNPSRTHWSLLQQLYTKEFVWIVPNDDNRVEDGRELRQEFIREEQVDYVSEEWLNLGCSFLEMLIALSRRLSTKTDGEPRAWFWHLLQNLRMDTYTDDQRLPTARIDRTLDCVIWRQYKKNGRGGLFPLRRATQDQTRVEIWYQAAAYLQQ